MTQLKFCPYIRVRKSVLALTLHKKFCLGRFDQIVWYTNKILNQYYIMYWQKEDW